MKAFKQNEFLDYIKKVKNNSDLTIESYKRDLFSFYSFLHLREIHDVNNITENDITVYLMKLKQLGKSPATISRNVATLRNYFSFLTNFGFTEINPAYNITPPKVERKSPEILTEEEINMLLNQPNLNTGLGFRDKAMLELLYASGLKVSELLSLNKCDVDLDLGYVVNKSKGQERLVKIDRKASNAIGEYLVKSSNKRQSQKSPLFLNSNGERLTRQGLWKIIKKHSQECGIKSEVTPHTIRHSFAIHSLKNGHDLNSLKEKLGLLHISSTNFYSDIMKNGDSN